MLRVGLTGGIAAGKSLAASELAKLGAVVIDADALAREVVQSGQPALAEIIEVFGPEVLLPTGDLDRPALGSRIFGDPAARERLNSIVHPRVRERAAALVADAPPGAIIVEDIPLLVETGQGPRFHLVIVVDAPEELRVRRMVDMRGMTEGAARERIAAQASTADRNREADVVLENAGTPDAAVDAVRQVWRDRLVPYNGNLAAGRPATRGAPQVVPHDVRWAESAARIGARLLRADERILQVEHTGPTSAPGPAAADVLDLLVVIDAEADLPTVSAALTTAGYPRGAVAPEQSMDGSPGGWLHANADPGRDVDLHLVARRTGDGSADGDRGR